MYTNYSLSLRNKTSMKKLLFTALITSSILCAHTRPGKLEVICGPMFAGKSEELIRRVMRAYYAQQTVLVVKPAIDTRSACNTITSHRGTTCTAQAINTPQDLLDLVAKGHPTEGEYNVIGIEEVQFFSDEIIKVILTLTTQGKRVIVAGLDLDYRGEPFGCIAPLLALADSVTKLQPICVICGEDAYRSQRLINEKPARYSDPLIMIGAEESYQARCKQCYIIES